jgi:hypothetical protein
MSSVGFDYWINGLDRASLIAFTQRLSTIRHVTIKTNSILGDRLKVSNQSMLESQYLHPIQQFLSMIHNYFPSCRLSLNCDSRYESASIEILDGRLALDIHLFVATSNLQDDHLTLMACLDSLHRIFNQPQYCVDALDIRHDDMLTLQSNIAPFLLTRFRQLQHLNAPPMILYLSKPWMSDILLFHYTFRSTVCKEHLNTQVVPASFEQTDDSSSASSVVNLRHAIFIDQPSTRQLMGSLHMYLPNLKTIMLTRCGAHNGHPSDLRFQRLEKLTFKLIPVVRNPYRSGNMAVKDSYRNLLFRIKMEGYETLLYHWKLPTQQDRETRLERSTYEYMYSYKRWTSKHSFTTVINCSRIDTVQVVYRDCDHNTHIQSIHPWEDRQLISDP